MTLIAYITLSHLKYCALGVIAVAAIAYIWMVIEDNLNNDND